MTLWNINALTLYDSLMGNTHTFNVLRPLPGLMAFLIRRRIRFASPRMLLRVFLNIMEISWVVHLRIVSVLDPIFPVTLIRLFSCWIQHWYWSRFAASSWNAVLAKVVYTTTRLVYRLCARSLYPLISLMM